MKLRQIYEFPMNFEIHRADTTSDIYENENIPQEEDLFAEKEEAYADTVSRSSEQAKVPEDVPPFQEEKAPRQPSRNPKSSQKEIQSGIVNIQHEIIQQEEAVKKEYKFPTLNLLKKGSNKSQGDSECNICVKQHRSFRKYYITSE